MKLAVTILTLISMNIAFAQQSETQMEPAAGPANVSTLSTENQSPSQGAGQIRMGLIKSFPDVSVETTFRGRSQSFEVDVEQNYGFSLGYASILPDQFGYMFDLNYMSFKDKEFSENFASVRLDGNVAYGFSNNVYGLAGLNMNKYISKWFKQNSKLGFGFQAGFGVQIIDNVALQAAYVRSNNDMRTGAQSVDGDIIMSGAELRLLATF